jgi:phenylpyruvate tautomerase PptA (4-oxalocrotonate tautomerase family)
MPLIRVYTSASVPEAVRMQVLLSSLSSTLAHELGKRESDIMTILHADARMTFAGTAAPACYAELKNVGEQLSAPLTARLSNVLCRLLSDALELPTSRIYIEFCSVAPHHWGWDGSTFA